MPDWSRIFRRRAPDRGAPARRFSCFDLEWELEADVSRLSPGAAPPEVRGPFCPGCGRRVEKRERALGGMLWQTVENPCKKCGRRASHTALTHTIPALKRGVLAEAERRAREGGPA